MEQSELMSDEAKAVVADKVNESLGTANTPEGNISSAGGEGEEGLSKATKERLGRQESRHRREMRALQDRIAMLESSQMQTPQAQPQSFQQPMVGMDGQSMQMPQGSNDPIQQAVQAALNARDQQAKLAEQQAQQAHLQKQYLNLQSQLDHAASKYEDFDDVVRGHDVPFTKQMRDTALLLPNAADVLYKLGKNRPELERISALHPIEQAKEMIRLSHSLAPSVSSAEASSNMPAPTMGQVKTNPVSSSAITDKTPASVIRARMKAGSWK